MKPLPTVRAALLAEPERAEQPWLVEGLWMREAVGIIGGEPKCGKSFLALDLAVAVAAAIPCLRHFPARQSGPVLLYAAEDAASIVRQRLEGIAYAAGVDFPALDVHVITAPALRLDRSEHCKALRATVAALRPKLLVLDPFVRLHAIDENAAGEVAPLLGFLRSIQRELHTAVALVHHARKGAAHERGGQALRGSSELHAWGDSNLYLRRQAENLYLAIEHRAAPSKDRLQLTLRADPPALALTVVDNGPAQPPDRAQPSSLQRIEQILADSAAPSPSASYAMSPACAPVTSPTSSPSSSRPAASTDPLMATGSTPDPSGVSRFPPIGSCGNGNGKQRRVLLLYCNLMWETAEAHPPGAAVARSPNGASDAAQRGWAPIPLVSQSELRA